MNSSGRKRHLLFLLKAAISGLLIYLVIDKTGLGDIAASFQNLGGSLVIALLFSFLFTFMKAIKWHVLVSRGGGPGPSTADAVRSYFVGMMGGLLTPGRVGEIARTVFLEKHDRGLIAYLVAVDKLFDVTAVLWLALPGIYYYAHVPALAGALLVLALLSLGIFFPQYPPRWLKNLLGHSGRLAGVRQRLDFIQGQLAAISPGFKLKFLGLTLLCYATVICQFFWLVENYHHCRLWMIAVSQPLIMLTNILPVTIAGLGIREGAAAALLSPFGVPQPAAIASAFMLFLLNTAIPALIGALLILVYRRSGYSAEEEKQVPGK